MLQRKRKKQYYSQQKCQFLLHICNDFLSDTILDCFVHLVSSCYMSKIYFETGLKLKYGNEFIYVLLHRAMNYDNFTINYDKLFHGNLYFCIQVRLKKYW